MFNNYLKIAIRQLLRNKTFSVINILGLAVGMGAATLILLWIQSEVSYDSFHSKKERIYELWNRGEYSGSLECWNTTPKIAASCIKSDIPEVDKVARVDWGVSRQISIGNNKFSLLGNVVDKEFLEIFDFPLVKGNAETALSDAASILLTESTAKKLFGSQDPIGKTLVINNTDNFKVSGLLKDPPLNTRFYFEYLIGWEYLKKTQNEESGWGNNSTHNYILLKHNASIEAAQNKIKNIRKKYQEPRDAFEMFFYPLKRWRLYSNFENGKESGGRIEYVRLFGFIAAFILIVACINFMNLSTARSEKRAREVGIRKTVGAHRAMLIKQFLGESLLLVAVSYILAVTLVQWSLPAFNELVQKKLAINFVDYRFWLYSLVFILFTGFLAGSYPAIFLSSFNATKVLKGVAANTRALVTPRKILVIIQFCFAIILIISTIIVKQQIIHVQQRQAGYNRDNLVYVYITGEIGRNYHLIKRELLGNKIASSVCKTSSPFTQGWSDSWGFEWKGKDPNDRTDFDRYGSDEDLVSTAGLSLMKGRDFNLTRFPSDSFAVILNESAAKAMKFKNPIGEIIKDGDVAYKVIGVIRDFILHSPYQPTRPMIILGAGSGWINTVHLKFNKNISTESAIAGMEKIFQKYNPGHLFEYSVIRDEYERKFASEQRTGSLAALFAALTIFISCLGLFGLSAFMAQSRIKEIGIRKVLGASVSSITRLLSFNFLKLVLVSFIIATPLAWWFMSGWLNDYPYRVEIKWWVFATAGLASVIISLLTVSFQAIKAAISNPVKSLRTE